MVMPLFVGYLKDMQEEARPFCAGTGVENSENLPFRNQLSATKRESNNMILSRKHS